MAPRVPKTVQIVQEGQVKGGFRASISRASVADHTVPQQRKRSTKRKSVADEDEPDEDDGHHIRQLIFALSDAIDKNSATPSRRSSVIPLHAERSQFSAAERLLDIIQRIVAANSTGRMQYKLQDFLLDFLNPPAPKIEAPDIDIQGRIKDRHDYWTPFRTNCGKWEGDPIMEERLTSEQLVPVSPSTGTQDQFLNTTSSFFSSKSVGGESNDFPDTASGLRKRKLFGTLHSFSETADGFFSTEVKDPLNWFPKNRQVERKQQFKLPGNAGYKIRGEIAAEHVMDKSQAKKKKVIDFSRHWDLSNWDCRIKVDVGNCPLCPCRSCCFVDRPKDGKRGRRTENMYTAYEEELQRDENRLHLTRSLPTLESPRGEEISFYPPHYTDPFNNRKTHENFVSAQRRYFAACEKQCMLPRMPGFLVGHQSSSLRLSDQSLLDHDLSALVDAIQTRKKAVQKMDLSKNNFTDRGLLDFLLCFPTGPLTNLNVSFSGAADGTLRVIADMMNTGCRRLYHLHLGGVNVSDSTWLAVCDSILEHNNLRTLGLQDAQLGRMCQRAPVKIAQLLGQLPFLERLDLSRNFLFHDACSALAEALSQTTSLLELDISHNASSYLVPPKRWQKKPVSLQKGKLATDVKSEPAYHLVANFNPILLLCEGFADNASLVSLSLSAANLNYSGDFVIMDALRRHPKLEFLDLSNNPHGEDGLRALLRLLMPQECRIQYCNLRDSRESQIHGLEVKFDFAEPRGHYELEFDHPQHRSVLRLLLDKASSSNEQIDNAFARLQLNPLLEKGKSWYWKSDSGWKFPASGHISFDFVISKKLPSSTDPVEVVKLYYRERRIAISMGRFVTLFSMYSNLADSHQKAMLIGAMQDQVLLKMAHLRKILQTTPELVEVIVNQLYATVESMDKLALFDLLKRPDANRRFRRNARAHFFFNENNPTDQYHLDLSLPSDRAVAERISVINLFETLPPNATDNTQHGFGEGVRNAVWDNVPIKHFANTSLHGSGILNLDYSSHRGPSKKNPPLLASVMESVIGLLELSECNHEDQVRALRGVSHLITVNPSQMRELLLKVPNRSLNAKQPVKTDGQTPQARRQSLLSKFQRGVARVKAFTKMGLVIKESAFQYADTNARLSMFIVFFNRCISQQELCTKFCLYDPKLFTNACAKEIQGRLGVLKTFDALACHDPESNCGNRFECRMFIHEEWSLAKFLLILAAKEDGENMVKCAWSERNFLAAQGYDFIPPGEWLRDLPMKGTFTATYVEEKEEYRLLNDRRKLAEQICWGLDT